MISIDIPKKREKLDQLILGYLLYLHQHPYSDVFKLFSPEIYFFSVEYKSYSEFYNNQKSNTLYALQTKRCKMYSNL